MSVVQVKAFELPLDLNRVSPLVLRDPEGRLLVDPLLMGVSYTEVLMESMESKDDSPQFQFDNITFVELEWLMPLYRPNKPFPPESRRKSAEVIKRLCLDCVAVMPGQTVEVILLQGC